MDYTKETFKESLDYLTEQEEKRGLNCYATGRFEMAKDCKNLILSSVSQQREQLETVIKELDLQVGTNYSADENLIDTLMSSF
jgi:hypothetical protein